MNVRVRYAPSPTGLQHIGGIRTALFNYFYARANGGTFLLRIEDTDRTRYSPQALEDLYQTFRWLGIDWDEGPGKEGDCGPYVQSERSEIYRKYAQDLIKNGAAYECFCSEERLAKLREEQSAAKTAIGYDRKCRALSADQKEALRNSGIKPVVRFAVNLEGETSFTDHLLGVITRKNTDVNPDPVLLKADGFPTYHLANVIDDHLMNITHILRAQEWISSCALHVLLYKAFGWEPPVYCHLPMVMGTDGQKLSKRHGATAVSEFRKAGYLPQALLNYVSLLGWSFDGKTDLLSKADFERAFNLEHLSKAPGIFDYKKLEWFNGQYIRMLEAGELQELLLPYFAQSGCVKTDADRELLKNAIPLIRERLKFLKEAPELLKFLFVRPGEYDALSLLGKKTNPAEARAALDSLYVALEGFEKKEERILEEELVAAAAAADIKTGNYMMPLRIAVTGSAVSPPLVPSLKLLGQSEVFARMEILKAKLATL